MGTPLQVAAGSFPRTQRDDDGNAGGGLLNTGASMRNSVLKCRDIHPRDVAGQLWLTVINHRIDDDDKVERLIGAAQLTDHSVSELA